ncbi:hypothetical protein BROUX41_006543 [Berkeleyomyces rouxiae]|uniref:uncharacterized protein n=1 Tax=Berkeleyomyces rouxiae TaxID=2035830 RepID=UPI003B7894F6
MAFRYISDWLFGEPRPQDRTPGAESPATLCPAIAPAPSSHAVTPHMHPFIEPPPHFNCTQPPNAHPELTSGLPQCPGGLAAPAGRTFTEQSPLLSCSPDPCRGIAERGHDDGSRTAAKEHVFHFPSIRQTLADIGGKIWVRSRVITQPITRHPIISFLFFVAILSTTLVLRVVFPPEPNIPAPWMPEYIGRRNFTLPLYRPESLATAYSLPLRTSGRHILDQKGRRFRLAAVNWDGASDELFVPGGLDTRQRSEIATLIRDLGFNTVRLPYSDELVIANPVVPARHVAANPDLIGLRALDILHATVQALTRAGIAVIINNRITQARWCCDADPCDAGWANSHLGPACPVRQTTDDWITHWTAVMRPLAGEPLVVGADLRNEVRGLWATMPWSSWAAAAEEAAESLLAINPDWLVVVEGTSSANDLTGVAARPLALSVSNRLVYSTHVYSWSGWGSLQGRYSQRKFKDFAHDMQASWGYLLTQDLAPVWVGEIGAPLGPDKGDANYWRNLMQYLRETDADFGYWALNPRKPHGNAYESYGLLEDDWQTVVKDYRLRDMLQLMNVTIGDWE